MERESSNLEQRAAGSLSHRRARNIERIAIILARLYWTFFSALSLYQMIAGHPLHSVIWIAGCAALITCALCWLSYSWAWMAAGAIGLIILAYQSYVVLMILPVSDEWSFTVNLGPIHFQGFAAKAFCWGILLFGFIFTLLLAGFGARRSDANKRA